MTRTDTSRRKRQIQPADQTYLHDYYASTSSSSSSSQPQRPALKRHGSSFPEQPAQVQSDLLSVGMRVRKSVPEGYKVKPPTSSVTFAATPQPSEDTLRIMQASQQNVRSSNPPRELVPFCGLLKVGGYGVQQDHSPTAGEGGSAGWQMGVSDAIGWLGGSQDSMNSVDSAMSTDSMPRGGIRKRWMEDPDDQANDIFDDELLFGQDSQAAALQGRRIAVPKSVLAGFGRNNSALPISAETMVDFEEASFLAPRDAEEMDWRH